jgi:hypothetical protein
MFALIVVFSIVYALNVIPAFAPPTWLVFSLIGFAYPEHDGIVLAISGAPGATLGRVTLAKLSRVIIRQKFLSEDTRRNIDAIREGLQGRRKLTFGLLLFYALSPFPSNYLFIAYGLTTMELPLIAAPFFLGRSISYSFWGLTSSAVARRISLESEDALPYAGVYFVVSQIFFLFLVYLLTRVNWRALLVEKRLRWTPRNTRPLPTRHTEQM